MANCPKKISDDHNDNCHGHLTPPSSPTPPRPIPPPSTPIDHSFSPYLIFMFCGLAVSISFISYLLFVARYRSRQRNHEEDTDETHEDFVNEDLGPVNHHPIWLINTIGLEQSQIESIQQFKYKKDQGLIEGTDCSVCLSEFEDDESLRLLPKCSHAFHVSCIDTWLRSHKNCPLCRAPVIIKQTNAQTETVIDMINSSHELSTREETPGEDPETVDHHVVEVENNSELEKTCRALDETSSGAIRANSDLADHHRVQGDGLVAMRRSVSMDESSASINVHFAMANVRISDEEKHLTSQWLRSKKPNNIPKSGHKLKGSSFRICSKAMKSSSFGHSSQKASRITNKCPHHNRSY